MHLIFTPFQQCGFIAPVLVRQDRTGTGQAAVAVEEQHAAALFDPRLQCRGNAEIVVVMAGLRRDFKEQRVHVACLPFFPTMTQT